MIEVHYLGNFGERLVQYLACRYLAERWKFALEAAPIVGIPATYLRVEGMRYVSPVLQIRGANMQCVQLGRPLPRELLATGPKAQIVVDSYCYDIDVLHFALDHVKDWLLPQFLLRRPRKGTVTLACHFAEPRLPTRQILHLSTQRTKLNYVWPSVLDILNALKGTDAEKVCVLTDRPAAPLWKELAVHIDCQIHDNGAVGNYREAISARTLLCAGTSLDWIASKTSYADEVIMIPPGNYPLDFPFDPSIQ